MLGKYRSVPDNLAREPLDVKIRPGSKDGNSLLGSSVVGVPQVFEHYVFEKEPAPAYVLDSP